MKLWNTYEHFPIQKSQTLIQTFTNNTCDYIIDKYYCAHLFSKYFGPLYLYYTYYLIVNLM